MAQTTMLGMAALASLLPAALFSMRRTAQGRDGVYWLLLIVAVAGPAAFVAGGAGADWKTGFSATLWVCVSVSMVLFAILALLVPQAWRLTPLLLPYMALLALFALIFSSARGKPLGAAAPSVWIDLHIVVSVITYGLLTMAAVAGLAAFMQERALKTKRPTALTRMLPSLADSERLSLILLLGSEIILGLGLATGMAVEYFSIGALLRLDHKILFSSLAFLVIAGLLLAHRFIGVRGRAAARFVLLSYLLLTLAYPGVKFVTEVLMN